MNRAATDPREAAFARIATAIGKYWICKRAGLRQRGRPECLGGASCGGIGAAAAVPAAPLNSIWEGSGKYPCLDVLRALAKEPDTGEALLAELLAGSGIDADFDAAFADAQVRFAQASTKPVPAQHSVERLAFAAAGGGPAARRQSPLLIAVALLGDGRGATYGTLASDIDGDAAIARIFPD